MDAGVAARSLRRRSPLGCTAGRDGTLPAAADHATSAQGLVPSIFSLPLLSLPDDSLSLLVRAPPAFLSPSSSPLFLPLSLSPRTGGSPRPPLPSPSISLPLPPLCSTSPRRSQALQSRRRRCRSQAPPPCSASLSMSALFSLPPSLSLVRTTQFWVLSQLGRKIGSAYAYFVGGDFFTVDDAFWVWVTVCIARWRQSEAQKNASHDPPLRELHSPTAR